MAPLAFLLSLVAVAIVVLPARIGQDLILGWVGMGLVLVSIGLMFLALKRGERPPFPQKIPKWVGWVLFFVFSALIFSTPVAFWLPWWLSATIVVSVPFGVAFTLPGLYTHLAKRPRSKGKGSV